MRPQLLNEENKMEEKNRQQKQTLQYQRSEDIDALSQVKLNSVFIRVRTFLIVGPGIRGFLLIQSRSGFNFNYIKEFIYFKGRCSSFDYFYATATPTDQTLLNNEPDDLKRKEK